MFSEYTQRFRRFNISTPWFQDMLPQSHMDYVQTTYKDTNKYSGIRTESPDGLTLTVEHIFLTEEGENEWFTDEYLATKLAERTQYNIENDIIEF